MGRLVLTRKVNESILIGGYITVTVVEIKGNQIRLGIDAPRTTDVLRTELLNTPAPITEGKDNAA